MYIWGFWVFSRVFTYIELLKSVTFKGTGPGGLVLVSFWS